MTVRAVILYTLKSDAGKCARIASIEKGWTVVSHQVTFRRESNLCRDEAEAILLKVKLGEAVPEQDVTWATEQMKLVPGVSTMTLKPKAPASGSSKTAALPKPKTVLRKFPAYFRLSDTTLAFIGNEARTRTDCLIWLGHAAPGRLSAHEAVPLGHGQQSIHDPAVH